MGPCPEWCPPGVGGVGPCPEWCPSGLGLRSLLFILYVNDMPDPVHCNIKMFADDTKLFTSVRSREDQEHLQCDIATLEDWIKDCLLEFNADK